MEKKKKRISALELTQLIQKRKRTEDNITISDIIISDSEFINCDFRNVTFENFEFTNCSFSYVKMTECFFKKTCLNGCSIEHGFMQQVEYSNCDFINCTFQTSLMSANKFYFCCFSLNMFIGCLHNSSKYNNCYFVLENSYFNTDLSNSDFISCLTVREKVSRTKFNEKTNLTGVVFDSCNFDDEYVVDHRLIKLLKNFNKE